MQNFDCHKHEREDGKYWEHIFVLFHIGFVDSTKNKISAALSVKNGTKKFIWNWDYSESTWRINKMTKIFNFRKKYPFKKKNENIFDGRMQKSDSASIKVEICAGLHKKSVRCAELCQLELRDDSLFQLFMCLRDIKLFCWMSHWEAAALTAQLHNRLSLSSTPHLWKREVCGCTVSECEC